MAEPPTGPDGKPLKGIVIEHIEGRSGQGRWRTKKGIYAPDGGPDIHILGGSMEADEIVDAGGGIEVNISDTDLKKPPEE
jgi:hypothetical protein